MANREKKIDSAASWIPVPVLVSRRRRELRSLLTDDSLRIRLQFFCVYLLFALVSLGMTVVNILTSWRLLMLSTLIFGLANIVNFLLCFVSLRAEQLSRTLFGAETILLFAFFVITGEPEGFSAIWAALLPTCGMLLFRMRYGTMLSLLELLILLFFFWTPIGQSLLQYEYTASFMLRFPLLYFAFMLAGVFFEFIRSNTQTELVNTRSRFEYLSSHDVLTELLNRHGFNDLMAGQTEKINTAGYAFAIMDLDHFKNVNDRFGHADGDIVLRRAAKDLAELIGRENVAARWGGEEFAVLFRDISAARELCERICEQRRSSEIELENGSCRVTVSIGLLTVPAGCAPKTSEIIVAADRNLYAAKDSGRDRIIETQYDPG